MTGAEGFICRTCSQDAGLRLRGERPDPEKQIRKASHVSHPSDRQALLNSPGHRLATVLHGQVFQPPSRSLTLTIRVGPRDRGPHRMTAILPIHMTRCQLRLQLTGTGELEHQAPPIPPFSIPDSSSYRTRAMAYPLHC